MKSNNSPLILVGLVVLISVLTNPSPEQHKKAIKHKVTTLLQKSVKENLGESASDMFQADQILATFLGGTLVDQFADNLISTNNYLLFSTTSLHWDGDSKTIAFGAFSNVFVTDKLAEAVKKELIDDK